MCIRDSVLHMAVIYGSNSGKNILRTSVGTGSNAQDFAGAAVITFEISSAEHATNWSRRAVVGGSTVEVSEPPVDLRTDATLSIKWSKSC